MKNVKITNILSRTPVNLDTRLSPQYGMDLHTEASSTFRLHLVPRGVFRNQFGSRGRGIKRNFTNPQLKNRPSIWK